MKRRNFLKLSSGTITLLPFTSSALSSSWFPSSDTMPDWLIQMIKGNDSTIERLLGLQIKDTSNPFFGGLPDAQEIINPHSTCGMILWGTVGFTSHHSKYHQSSAVLESMKQAAVCLNKLQHEDGTIDLLSTNFHSTPDTGFLVKRLVFTYQSLQQSKIEGISDLLEQLKLFLLKAGKAFTVGGIHTPNHRWVVSAALAQLYQLWPDPAYLKRINQWLFEKMDMDEDGQYNEKSTYIYSSLTNRLLILIAKGVNKPELLQYVRRNLDMTAYYVHPNGEVVTDASGRQDKAIIGTMENYYYAYRLLAIKEKNLQYAAMCRLIEKTAGDKIKNQLDYYLNDPEVWKPLPTVGELPVRYVKTFPYSGLVRIRNNNWDSSIIKDNPTWMTFMKNEAVLQGIRLASSFFGKGQFRSNQIEQMGPDEWKLTQTLKGPYYQPLPPELLPDDGDWDKMPRNKRPQTEIQTLTTTVLIRKQENGMQVEVQTEGTERVPIALELIFRSGGIISGAEEVAGIKDTWVLRSGTGKYVFKDTTISFGPGIGKHINTALRGALPHTGSPSVFLTGFTPFNHTITIA